MITKTSVDKRKLLSIAAALGVIAGGGGCGRDFDPYNRLASVRVLAIRSEPPAPATGETTTFTPVLYVPEGETIVSYQWSWCLVSGAANDGYPCLVAEAELTKLLGEEGAATFPSFDLGSDPTATLENSIDPTVLEAMCAGMPGAPSPPPFDCPDGFPAQVRLTVRTAADTEIVAVRRLRLRFDPASEPNANPTLDELVAEVEGSETPIDASATVTLARDVRTIVRARIPVEAAEQYTGRDD
ncbi:MAG: hypothetical protein V2A73_02615, partial [Pseudomonadota bacterium]